MSLWNISANYVLVPVKFNLNWNVLKTILEVFTSWFQQEKAWEHEFGLVPSISFIFTGTFIFTGSKMARIAFVYIFSLDSVQSQNTVSLAQLIGCSFMLPKVFGSFPVDHWHHLRSVTYICFYLQSRKTNNYGKDHHQKLWHIWPTCGSITGPSVTRQMQSKLD